MENMTLYQISTALQNAIDGCYTFDEETGEIYFDQNDLESIEVAMKDKAEACAIVAKEADALADAIDKEIKVLQQRKKQAQRKADSLRDYIVYCLEKNGIEKIETPKCKLSLRKSEYVEIIEEDELPERYVHYVTKRVPNKEPIKRAIKNGENVPGAALYERKNLQVK